MKNQHRWSGEWTQRGALGAHDLFTLNGEWDDILYIPVGAEGWAAGRMALMLSTSQHRSLKSFPSIGKSLR